MTAAEVVTRPSNEDRIKAALWFAEHGFGVFSCWSTRDDGVCRCPQGAACSSPGKHPITTNGFKDATQDPAKIRTVLSAASQPNYGLVCPDGVFAWDVDGDGVARLGDLEARYGLLPPTLRTDTANGQHVFLRWPEGLPRPLKQMFGYITRWGTGSAAGYVIGPNSVHWTGKVYRSSKGAVPDIATLPEAWARAAVTPDDHTIHITADSSDPGSVGVGMRHEYLRDRARFYAGSIRDPQVLFAAVWAENERLTQPKTEDEVRRAIGDALTKFPADPVEQDPATGEVRRVPSDEPGLLPPAGGEGFPQDPDVAAFDGLLGDAVAVLAEGTDASLVGMLAALVAFCGSLIPASAYFARQQTTSPFIALVGESSIGRKGTAMFRVQDALSNTVGVDHINRTRLDGVASGEALVNALHDKQASAYENCAGLVFEEEYATHLAAQGRDGSSLDPRMRQAFDGDQLSHRRVGGSITVKTPYWLSALIAITPNELRTRLPGGALQSGSANRWLWVPVTRRRVTAGTSRPEFPEVIRDRIQAAHRQSAKNPQQMTVDDQVGKVLSEYSEYLWAESVGLAADMTRRYAVIAFRIALVHAAVERSTRVGVTHLRRALALTEYARAGLGWVFGQSLGNPLATLLLRNLQDAGELRASTITRHIIRDPLKRQDAIDELVRLGLARRAVSHSSNGRPASVLQPTPLVGRFLPFIPRFQPEPAETTETVERMERTPHLSTNGLGRNPGKNLDGLEGTPLVDKSTGEVAERADATWLRPCRDYQQHQSHHRRAGAGWVCLACDQEDGT